MRPPLPILLAGLLSACSYTPARQADAELPKYQADRDACSNQASDTVDRNNAKHGLSWIAGPVTRWSRIDASMNACMDAHGWGHVRACTPDELRAGNRAPNLVVTANGVRCTDTPNRP